MGLLEQLIEKQEKLESSVSNLKEALDILKNGKQPDELIDINTMMHELSVKSRSEFNTKWQPQMGFIFRLGTGGTYRAKRSDFEKFKTELSEGKINFNRKKRVKKCGGLLEQ